MRVDQNNQNPDETTTPPQQDFSKSHMYALIAMCCILVVIGLIFKWDWMWGIGLAGLFFNCVLLHMCRDNSIKS